MIEILTGDFRELSKDIADDSFDLVLTDPPYSKEFLPLWDDLGRIAARVLRPGGWLLSYGATEHLPHHIETLGAHLDYFWVFTLLHHGAHPRMWVKRLYSGYKPILAYTKGKPAINPWIATVYTASNDKRYHKWGQGIGPFLHFIEKLTDPNDLIYDPFLGGGTTAVACYQLGRNCIGHEIDPEMADIARKRLAETQPPLPRPKATQPMLV